MFKDRKDAGEQLAKALNHYKNSDVMVVGIPRGGVEPAYYVASHIRANDLSVVVTRKLGYPDNPEAAFGALAEDDSFFIFEDAERNLAPEIIQSIVDRERGEIARRIKVLRRDEPLPDFRRRTVILVDDGIATGATLMATIKLCRNKGASRIVVAAPVASDTMKEYLTWHVDEVIILETPFSFYAVSQAYQFFNEVTDEEVLAFLDRWRQEQKHADYWKKTQIPDV